jgi:O-antigen/teichoic acid export membrane protein
MLDNPTVQEERPYGLVLFAWLYIILGTFILVEAVTGLASPAPIDEGMGTPSIYVLLLFLVLGPAFVVAGAGMRAYRRWGRTLAIILSLITATFSMYALFIGLNLPWGVFLALLSIGYLTRRKVRAAFGMR